MLVLSYIIDDTPVATSDSFIVQRSTGGGESEHIWVPGEG
jgi:hypothetical protein